MKRIGSMLGLLSIVLALPSQAAPLSSVKILRIIDGKEVFVNGDMARENQIAGDGGTVSSKKSRAELLFDRRAIGFLGTNTLIKVGSRCFSIDSGIIVVNGPQRACIGSRILGVRGTTYAVARESGDSYTVSVLAGESVVANDLPQDGADSDILSKYPKAAPWVSLQAGGFGSVYPSGGGGFTGGLNYFVPISQSGAKSILYSSTSLGSSFLNLWGVATEVGYRRFLPSTRTITSAYVGYSGYGAPGCYSNLVNVGAQLEKSRWRIGASGGLKVNDCPQGLSFGAINLSVPVGRIKDQPLYLLISPYFLAGNAVGTGLLNDTNSNFSPGIRASVDVPVNDRLSLKAYTGADGVFGVTVGALFRYRLPTGQGLYRDPSSPPDNAMKASSSPLESSNWSNEQRQSSGRSADAVLLAMSGQGDILSDYPSSTGLATIKTVQVSSSANEIKAGQRGRFNAAGELLMIETIPRDEFINLLTSNLAGHNPLPESRRIGKQAAASGILNTTLAGILGLDFMNNASLPVSTTVDVPFSPLTQIPVGSYVCAATSQARAIGAQEAKPGQFDYRGEAAYFGRGSKASQGYPVTANKSDAYVFTDPGVCKELNRLANQGYDIVQAEQL